MSALIQQLHKLISEEFIDEEDEAYRAELLPCLLADELATLTAQMPAATLPQEVGELLYYSKGIKFGWLEEVRFDAFSDFGRLGLFPSCIELTHDGTGNYWVLDINQAGRWGSVFYVCHDPQVIVKQANSLLDFLIQLQEYGRLKSASRFDEVYERLSSKIWEERATHTGLVEASVLTASTDAVLRQFAAQQPPKFLIADLRIESVTQGFSHHNFFRDNRLQISKHELEPIWAFEPPPPSWFSKFLSRLRIV